MTFREAQRAVTNLSLRRHDSRNSYLQPTMCAGMAENEQERAWSRDATCAGWNATALALEVVDQILLTCTYLHVM